MPVNRYLLMFFSRGSNRKVDSLQRLSFGELPGSCKAVWPSNIVIQALPPPEASEESCEMAFPKADDCHHVLASTGIVVDWQCFDMRNDVASRKDRQDYNAFHSQTHRFMM